MIINQMAKEASDKLVSICMEMKIGNGEKLRVFMKDRDGVVMPRLINPENFDGRKMRRTRHAWNKGMPSICENCRKSRYSIGKLTGMTFCKKCNHIPTSYQQYRNGSYWKEACTMRHDQRPAAGYKGISNQKKCPLCKNFSTNKAKVCQWCGKEIDEVEG